ncbi:MAG: LysR family transcriptional regulator [Proteobacteria bacterium]|nr:LysR family transcriptional regulator [Pseudomonadota bacterium]
MSAVRESVRGKSRSLAHWRVQDLEVFVQLVECGSFTRAGQVLGMSTSAISKRLSALEDHLHARLLDRTSRTLAMTGEGREFHARAASICQQLREAESSVSAATEHLHGTLRVSIPTAAVEMGILADLVEIGSRHPALNLEIYLSDRSVDLNAKALDASLFLTDDPERHPGDLVLGLQPTVLAAAPEFLDRMGRPSAPEDLAALRSIRAVSRRGNPIPWRLYGPHGAECVVPVAGPTLLTDDLRVTYMTAMAGGGIARAPLAYLADARKPCRLEWVLPQWRFQPIVLMAALRHKHAPSKKVKALIDLVKVGLERMAALAAGGPLEAPFKAALAEDRERFLRTHGERTGSPLLQRNTGS